MEPPPSILGLGFQVIHYLLSSVFAFVHVLYVTLGVFYYNLLLQDASATNPGGGIPMGLGSSGQPSLPPLPTLNTNIASFQQATSSSPLHSPVTHSPGSGQLSPTVSVGSKPGAESPIGSRKDVRYYYNVFCFSLPPRHSFFLPLPHLLFSLIYLAPSSCFLPCLAPSYLFLSSFTSHFLFFLFFLLNCSVFFPSHYFASTSRLFLFLAPSSVCVLVPVCLSLSFSLSLSL